MHTRRLAAYSLMCLGFATLTFVGGRYAIGASRQQDARRAWEAAEARAVVSAAGLHATVDGLVQPAVIPGAPVARLLIPRIGMDQIVIEGVDDDALNAGPGHLPGSAYPGEAGHSIVSAHRDRHFARLGEVQIGDTLVTESGAQLRRWIVVKKRVVKADTRALFRTRDATLTLTTCWPIRAIGTAPERLLVTAKLLKAADIGSFAGARRT